MEADSSKSQLVARDTYCDQFSLTSLLPVVYERLRAIAASYLGRDMGKHTLQPTALVHEAFVRLANYRDSLWERDHFIAVAATAMRQVLVDHARRKNASKRGGGARRATISLGGLEEATSLSREWCVLELEELLQQLASVDARAARVAELKLFGGMELEQIARVESVSRVTICTDWQFARAWLASYVSQDATGRK